VAQVFDIADTFTKGYEWGIRPEALGVYAVTLCAAIAGFLTERRPVQLVVAIVAFAALLLYQFQELGVLGAW